jgi:hypothetical protein
MKWSEKSYPEDIKKEGELIKNFFISEYKDFIKIFPVPLFIQKKDSVSAKAIRFRVAKYSFTQILRTLDVH